MTLRRLALALPLVCAALLAPAASASAAPPCGPALADAGGTTFTLSSGDGSAGFSDGVLGQLFTTFGTLSVPDPNACTTEEGGSEVVYPEQPVGPPYAGLALSRKVFVPASGTPRIRFLHLIRNTSPVPQSFEVWAGAGHSPSRLRGTGSGDLALTPGDAWAVLADQPPPGAPLAGKVVAHVWDAAPGLGAAQAHLGVHVSSSVSSPGFTDPGNTPNARYVVTVAPGATAALMTLGLVRSADAAGLASALADAPVLAAGSPDAYAGLSATELSQLVNWPNPDPDGDGVRLNADNCRTTANAGQEDLDRDGTGDACDPDVDGDGVSDALETALGANPRSSDSDGDGRGDGADACPSAAGSQPNGCPPASADTTPNAITGAALTAPAKLTRAAFLKGVRIRTGCAEACTIAAELRGTQRAGVRISAKLPSFRVVLGAAAGKRAAGLRNVTVRPSPALVGKARRFTVQVRVTLTDAAGNQTVRTKTIKVG